MIVDRSDDNPMQYFIDNDLTGGELFARYQELAQNLGYFIAFTDPLIEQIHGDHYLFRVANVRLDATLIARNGLKFVVRHSRGKRSLPYVRYGEGKVKPQSLRLPPDKQLLLDKITVRVSGHDDEDKQPITVDSQASGGYYYAVSLDSFHVNGVTLNVEREPTSEQQ